MDIINRKIDNFRGTLKEQYGFVADPRPPLWKNAEEAQLKAIDVTKLLARLRNNACHNLLHSRPLPDGTPQLLDLGLNYCVKPSSTNEMTKGTFSQLENDICGIYHLGVRDAEESRDYIPKLYLKSKYAFKDAPQDTKESIVNFIQAIQKNNTS